MNNNIITTRVNYVLIGFGALFFAALVDATEKGWEVGTRMLPNPAGSSEELRKSIAATPQPDVKRSKMFLQNTDATDWENLKALRAASRGKAALQLAENLKVAVERQDINDVTVRRITPQEIDPKFKDAVFLYLHGGAYVFGGGDASIGEAAIIANSAKISVISVDYRMPPTSPFPAAVDDVVTVYRHLLKTVPAQAIAIGGTSAGGGLALSAVHKFISLGLPTPSAIYAGTPWADLTKTGDSLFTNEGIDRVLVTYDGSLGAAAQLYAAGHDMKDPLISPVYGDFVGFPPTYFVTGTRDMFLSDTSRVHRKLRTAGIVAELNVYEGMSHAGYAFNLRSPESKQVYSELRNFLVAHLE